MNYGPGVENSGFCFISFFSKSLSFIQQRKLQLNAEEYTSKDH
jgi:hypothetical protein